MCCRSGTQHSFPLEEVFAYLNSKTVRDILVQALLDAPMFPIRWRWNATRALALPRQRGGHKIPAPLQRMESENLLAAVFPDQLACLENIEGDRVIPRHPLVQQTIEDCLTEAMDINSLIDLLKRIENGAVQCIGLDLPEPSPLAHEILQRQAVRVSRQRPTGGTENTSSLHPASRDQSADGALGVLDLAAIQKVCQDAWPRATNPDEMHEALLLLGAMTEDEVMNLADDASDWLGLLGAEGRAGRIALAQPFWVAAERWSMIQAIYPGCDIEPALVAPQSERGRPWERADAVRELVRGRMEVAGPITAEALSEFFRLPFSEVQGALLALESEGFILRGRFHPGAPEMEWCDRRLLARIHRLTINRLRAEIQPV